MLVLLIMTVFVAVTGILLTVFVSLVVIFAVVVATCGFVCCRRYDTLLTDENNNISVNS